ANAPAFAAWLFLYASMTFCPRIATSPIWPGRNRIAILVQDRNLAAGCETYRPRFSVSRWQGVTGYLVRRFCHTVGLDDGRVKYRFQFLHNTRRQGRRR